MHKLVEVSIGQVFHFRESYGRYEYEGTYPTGTNNALASACCYEFTGNLPLRKSPNLPRGISIHTGNKRKNLY